ncbi:hypothetical protein HPB50_001063 [Hyalomma asiaticum]|uniref:Uncharacterized protein n=1 Tax=Hyalomma asiaticum TaxID=266040 RepID=A0ACB7RSE6_HYAAI|nr:hypothetical protein HPB50_001063 [Hyalomma asiaticum]
MVVPWHIAVQCELIRYHGYPCKLSYATTDDGYVLEVDHIPHGRRGFLLADRGFDVWSMNSREAKPYSKHMTISQKERKYWRWSFDEIGRYDLAACVDHVLRATGAPKLTIMALSQGVVMTLVLLSTRPEYNDKVNLVIAYGPVANITHAGRPMPAAMRLLPPVLMYKAKNFVMYDHGVAENRRLYGQVAPPAYPIERIRTPIAVFSSQGDVLAATNDVADLLTRLGSNVIIHRVMPEKGFGHMDFAVGYHANECLHNVAMDLIQWHQTQRARIASEEEEEADSFLEAGGTSEDMPKQAALKSKKHSGKRNSLKRGRPQRAPSFAETAVRQDDTLPLASAGTLVYSEEPRPSGIKATFSKSTDSTLSGAKNVLVKPREVSPSTVHSEMAKTTESRALTTNLTAAKRKEFSRAATAKQVPSLASETAIAESEVFSPSETLSKAEEAQVSCTRTTLAKEKKPSVTTGHLTKHERSSLSRAKTVVAVSNKSLPATNLVPHVHGGPEASVAETAGAKHSEIVPAGTENPATKSKELPPPSAGTTISKEPQTSYCASRHLTGDAEETSNMTESPIQSLFIFGHGGFQRVVLVFACVAVFVSYSQSFLLAVESLPVKYWCKTDAPTTSTLGHSLDGSSKTSVQSQDNNTLGQCTRPDTSLINGTSTSTQVPCDHWEYDQSHSKTSIVPEWDLVCQRSRLKHLIWATFMTGGAMAVPTLGFTADLVGRRPVLIGAVFLLLLSGSVVCLCKSLLWFTALRFMSALLLTCLVYTIEESPHWCLYHNKFDDAERVALWAARLNFEDPDLVRDRLERIRKEAELLGGQSAWRPPRLLRYITSDAVRSRCFALFGCWLFVYIAYYARDYGNLGPGSFLVALGGRSSLLFLYCSSVVILNVAYVALVVHTVDTFPTPVRSLGYSGAFMSGRVGAMMGAMFREFESMPLPASVLPTAVTSLGLLAFAVSAVLVPPTSKERFTEEGSLNVRDDLAETKRSVDSPMSWRVHKRLTPQESPYCERE